MESSSFKSHYSIVSQFSDKRYHILLRSDEVVQVNLTATVYNRNDIERVIEKIRELTKDSTRLVMVITDKGSRITPDGIRKLFSKASTSYPVAKAYVISRPVHFILSRLCMKLYKPKTPIKFFANQASAESWLESLISC